MVVRTEVADTYREIRPHSKDEAVDAMIALLYEEPEAWRQDSCTLRHKSGVSLWTGSGALRLYTPIEMPIGFFDVFKVHKAMRYAIAEKARRAIKGAQNK